MSILNPVIVFLALILLALPKITLAQVSAPLEVLNSECNCIKDEQHDATMLLAGRQILPAGTCTSKTPCADVFCYDGSSGFCQRDPDHRSAAVCNSNCDTKADCAIGASTPGAMCPLNVYCSAYRNRGVTSDFCYTLIWQSLSYHWVSSGIFSVPVNKLILGLGFYCRTYRLSDSTCNGFCWFKFCSVLAASLNLVASKRRPICTGMTSLIGKLSHLPVHIDRLQKRRKTGT
jgi:hypothetical protein